MTTADCEFGFGIPTSWIRARLGGSFIRPKNYAHFEVTPRQMTMVCFQLIEPTPKGARDINDPLIIIREEFEINLNDFY